jgi:hypothetical protein
MKLLITKKEAIHDIIKSILLAKKFIIICNWYCNLFIKIGKNNTLIDIILYKCNQNVKVYILSWDNQTLIPINVNTFPKHKNLEIKILSNTSDNESIYSQLVPKNIMMQIQKLIYLNNPNPTNTILYALHQRYALIDDIFYIGCMDFNEYENLPFEFFECCLKINNPSTSIKNFVINNHILNGDYETTSNTLLKLKYNDHIIVGNHKYTNTEFYKILTLISNTTHLLIISQQFFDIYSNPIGNHIIDLLIKNKNVKIIIIIEKNFIDDDSFLYQSYLIYIYKKSINYLLRNLNNSEKNRLIICSILKSNGKPHHNHCKLIFSDTTFLLTTSNFFMCSITPNKDRELGIIISNSKVKNMLIKYCSYVTQLQLNKKYYSSDYIFNSFHKSLNIHHHQ